MSERINPFPGLRPFNRDENSIFFGRTKKVDDLLTLLAKRHFTAVVGTSGSGKSSLVGAGVLAALARGLMTEVGSQWRIAFFRPGNNPIKNLADQLAQLHPDSAEVDETAGAIEQTLRRSSLGLKAAVEQLKLNPGENILIVVDQFEELFRYQSSFVAENPADEAASFVKLLLVATANPRDLPIYVVLTMRSEYLGECAQFSGLPEAINEGQYLIPRMNDDERRDAITIPVTLSGAKISEPLINRFMNDSGDDPDKLPLLQHSLMRTWQEWNRTDENAGKPLDISHYVEIGTLHGALSDHANEAFNELSQEQQLVAARLFKALATKGLDNRGIRTPRKFGELRAIVATPQSNPRVLDRDIRAVIDAYRRSDRSFLTPGPTEKIEDDTLIDISHESLIQGWNKLQGWVDEEADSARTYKRLAEHAVLFDKKEERLLSEPALPLLIKWYAADQQPNEAWARSYFDQRWKPRFREGGSPDSDYDNEFRRAVAFLDQSQRVYEKELAAKRNSGRRKMKVLGMVAAIFALLSVVAVFAAAAAQRNASQAAVAQHQADQARKEAEDQLAKTARAQEETSLQKRLAEEATVLAEGLRAEAEKQKDLADDSATAAIQSKEEAVEAKEIAEQANKELLTKAKELEQATAQARENFRVAEAARQEAFEARTRALTALRVAEAKKDEAEKARKNAEEQRQLTLQALNNRDATLITLKSADNETPSLNAISRQDDPIATATFDRSGNRAFVTDNKRASLYEMRNTEPQFTKEDFRNLPRLFDKLATETTITNHLTELFSPEARSLVLQYEPSETVSDQLIDTLLTELNALLKEPALYDERAFRTVNLRKETRKLLGFDLSGEQLSIRNRKLLEDAFPLEIKAIGRFEVKHNFESNYVFAMSSDGELVAGKHDDTEIDIFDKRGAEVETKECVGCSLSTVNFSKNAKYIWSKARQNSDLDHDHILFAWEIGKQDSKEPAYEIDLKRPISQAVLSPDERHFVITSPQLTGIEIWDLIAGKHIRSLDETEGVVANVPKSSISEDPKSSLVNTITFSDDGQFVAATFKNNKDVRVWKVSTGQLIRTLRGHRCQVNSAEFSRNGKRVVAAGDDGSAIVWDLENDRKWVLRGYRGLLIYGSRSGLNQFLLLPLFFKRDSIPIEGEFVPLNSAKFDNTASGEKLVTTSVDGKVRVWTVEESGVAASPSLVLQGYSGSVRIAEFSPDDQYVIAGGEDGVARIWHVGKGIPSSESRPKSCANAKQLSIDSKR